MQTTVDFYILPKNGENKRLYFACRLIDKIYQQNHRLYIHNASQQATHYLDELLWQFKEDSFIPHNCIGEGPEKPPPIQLGYEKHPTHHNHLLLNLTDTVPDFFNHYKRVIEIISTDPTVQALGRTRYRHYQQQGCAITTHKPTTG